MRALPVFFVLLVSCGSRSLSLDSAAEEETPGFDAAGPCTAPWKAEWDKCEWTDPTAITCWKSYTMPGAGLPLGGLGWRCHHKAKTESIWCCCPRIWICEGETLAGAPAPGGCGWECKKLPEHQHRYSCEKFDSDEDHPPGTMLYPVCKCAQNARCAVCDKGSAVGGTVCRVLVPSE